MQKKIKINPKTKFFPLFSGPNKILPFDRFREKKLSYNSMDWKNARHTVSKYAKMLVKEIRTNFLDVLSVPESV